MIALVEEEAFQEAQFASNMWARAITSSPQLTTYFLGYSQVMGLFEETRAAPPIVLDMVQVGETTGALDSMTGRTVLKVLKEVTEQLGATVPIITHAAATAAMADRVIHFADGAIRRVIENKTKQSPEEIRW